MSIYIMELPSTDKRTCEIAINWIKKNYPYITKGFIDAYTFIDLRAYNYSTVIWYDADEENVIDSSFLYWGYEPKPSNIIVPFPDYDSIDIGEL